MILSTEAIGTIAAICTTCSFLPQILKVLKTRSVEGISIVMYVIYCTGAALWFAYGLLLHSHPLIFSNILTLIFSLIILILKILWEKK